MVSNKTANVIILMAAVAHFSFAQAQLSCDDGLLMIYRYFHINFGADLPFPLEQSIFVCQHMALHHFINTTAMADLMPVMNTITNSLCHLWVSNLFVCSCNVGDRSFHSFNRVMAIIIDILTGNLFSNRMENMSTHCHATQHNFSRQRRGSVLQSLF